MARVSIAPLGDSSRVGSLVDQRTDSDSVVEATESGDGELIARALLSSSSYGGPIRFYGAFAAAAGQSRSVLSAHWRYLYALRSSCYSEYSQRSLTDDLVLAHILHDQAWVEALRERQTMNVHLDDLLLSVAP